MATKKDIQHWIHYADTFSFKGRMYRVLEENICTEILKDYDKITKR